MPNSSDRCRQTPVWIGSTPVPAFVEYRKSRGAKRMRLPRSSTNNVTPRPGGACVLLGMRKKDRAESAFLPLRRYHERAQQGIAAVQLEPHQSDRCIVETLDKKVRHGCRGQVRRRQPGAFQQSHRRFTGGPRRNAHARRPISHQAALRGFLFVFAGARAGLHVGSQASTPSQQFSVR